MFIAFIPHPSGLEKQVATLGAEGSLIATLKSRPKVEDVVFKK